MDLKFYLTLLLRRLHYVLLFTILGAGIGVALAVLLPPVYRAASTLVVESEQIPDELAASTVQTEASEQLQIIQQRIFTRETLLEMANRLQIYAPLPGQAPARLEASEVVEDLRDRISISAPGGGGGRGPAQANIVTVAFSAPTAELAASVANEVVTLILQENVEMRTTVSGQTLDFFNQQVERLDGELEAQEAEILAFQEANQAALPESLDFRRGQLTAEQERLVRVERDLGSLGDRRARLVELYETTGSVGDLPAAAQTPEQRQLQELRNQLSSALAVLSPTNPRIRVIENQIASLEAVVAGQATGQAGGGGGTQLSLYELQLADLDGQIADLTEQREQVTANMERLQASIAATPENAIVLGTLERNYAALRAQYDQAVSNRARAATGDTIEALSKGQRISVIEPAVIPPAPESPNRPLVAAMGLGGGLALGLGLVALMELLNRSVRRPVEITNKLGIMPFGALPLMRSRFDVRRRRLKIAAAFAVAAVGLPTALWLVHSQVMPLDLLVDRVMQRLELLAQAPQPAPSRLV